MKNVPYPTTLILLAVITCVTVLGWNGTLDGQAVSGTLSAVVAAVTVGHYVKTSPHGNGAQTTTTTTPDGTTVTSGPPPAPTKEAGQL